MQRKLDIKSSVKYCQQEGTSSYNGIPGHKDIK
jgi:hypothetical protein